jgi:hypothetical protein
MIYPKEPSFYTHPNLHIQQTVRPDNYTLHTKWPQHLHHCHADVVKVYTATTCKYMKLSTSSLSVCIMQSQVAIHCDKKDSRCTLKPECTVISEQISTVSITGRYLAFLWSRVTWW